MSLLNDISNSISAPKKELMAYIDAYEESCPFDCMISTARAIVYFFAEEYESAAEYIKMALDRNPANYMNRLYCALIEKARENYANAILESLIAANFAFQFGAPENAKELAAQLNDIINQAAPMLTAEENQELGVMQNILSSKGGYFPAYKIKQADKWPLFLDNFLYFDKKKEYNDYVCLAALSHDDMVNHNFRNSLLNAALYTNYAITPIEIWKAKKLKRYEVSNGNCVVAVASTVQQQTIQISPVHGMEMDKNLPFPNIYHYLSLDEDVKFSSKDDFIVSKPVFTKGDPEKKKLVLALFLDGIPQSLLNSTNYEDMPYTKEFFSKGTIFENCFSTGEWTLTSVPSLVTGLYATHHHILYHSSSAYRLPQNTNTVAEIFSENGFFTTSIDGSVATSPYIGGLRGFDRCIKKHGAGFPDRHLISDALDHLAAFLNANQFLYLGLIDVHNSKQEQVFGAGTLSVSIFQQTAVNYRIATAEPENDVSTKSVRKKYDKSLIEKYRIAMRQNDRELKPLYDYILSHYTEDEFIVCMYSDHGISFADHEDFLLKRYMTNSALMLRGSGIPAQISDEYINHFDYIPVITKLAGIPFDFSEYDCVIPRTFGGPGREYAYSESIYPKQTYKAAVRNEEYEYRFETNGMTDIDGLIDLSQGFTQKLLSARTGEALQDPQLLESFEAVVFDHIKENIKY